MGNNNNKNESMLKRILLILLLGTAVCASHCVCSREGPPGEAPARPAAVGPSAVASEGGCRLETIDATTVITLEGTPEQIGTFYGKTLAPTIRRVIKQLITDDFGSNPAAYRNILAGGLVMEAFQPEDYLAELKAVANAAKVSYENLLLLQYFGDVRRCIDGPGASPLCTSFAILPPYTKGNVCIVGRNFDYYDNGVGDYASIIAYYRPRGKIPFITITWAGIMNGWTLLNEKGLVVSNNTCWGGRNDSLRGISTCFLLRYLAEQAESVEQAIEIVKSLPRSCGTALLIASGRQLDAAIVEFDHDALAVRWAVGGFVGAGNGFQKLYQGGFEQPYWGRIGTAYSLVQKNKGMIDLGCNIAGAEGVPITSMNLHSAMIDATNARLRVAMGGIPAYRLPFKAFRLTKQGLAVDPDRGQQKD